MNSSKKLKRLWFGFVLTILHFPFNLMIYVLGLALIPVVLTHGIDREIFVPIRAPASAATSGNYYGADAVRVLALDRGEERLIVVHVSGRITHYDRIWGDVVFSCDSGKKFLHTPTCDAARREIGRPSDLDFKPVAASLNASVTLNSIWDNTQNWGDVSQDGTIGIVATNAGEILGWKQEGDRRSPFFYRIPVSFDSNSAVPNTAMNHQGTRLCAAIKKNTAAIFDVQTGAMLRELPSFPSSIQMFSYSKNGEWIVFCCHTGDLFLFSDATGNENWSDKSEDEIPRICAVSSDGRWIALGLKTGIAVYDTTKRKDEARTDLDCSVHSALKMTFSMNSRSLFVGRLNGGVEEWLFPALRLGQTFQ